MKRALLTLATLLLFTPLLYSRAEISEKNRVRNQKPGYCAWASLETMCRHQQIKAGYDLVEKRKKDPDKYDYTTGQILWHNLGYDSEVESKLHDLKINFKMNRTHGNRQAGIDLIVHAVQNGHGAMVGLKCAPGCPTAHAVTIIDINDQTFEYVDSNSPKETWVGSIDWFLWAWDGYVITVE